VRDVLWPPAACVGLQVDAGFVEGSRAVAGFMICGTSQLACGSRGASIPVTVQAWMGHASIATTNLYLHHLGTLPTGPDWPV
jgi:hypothetical protein